MRRRQRYRLEPLNESHRVEAFTCEEDDINEYLREEALLDMERGVARTFVEIDRAAKPATPNVAGFFTLRAHALRIDESYFEDWQEASGDEDKSFPSPIEVPLVELMWLGRDLQWRGKGLGDTLMIEALKIVAQAADCIGFVGLHLRSTERGVRLYQRYDFQKFREHPTFDGMHYILPVHVIRAIVEKLNAS